MNMLENLREIFEFRSKTVKIGLLRALQSLFMGRISSKWSGRPSCWARTP